MRQFLSSFLILSMASNALAEPLQTSGEIANKPTTIREKLAAEKAKRVLREIKNDPGSIRRYGQRVLTKTNESLEKNPAGKAGKAWVNKASMTYATTLALLIAKEGFGRLSEENLEVNEGNITKKIQEIETEWAPKEKAIFVALDAAILFPLSVGLEKGVTKALPKIAEKQFAGQLMNSFIVGLMMSVGLNFINQTILLANRFLIEHPELFGGLSTNEIKALTLLNERFGMSYFTFGLIKGGPVTKSAYRKVLSSLSYVLFQEDELRNVLWSHVARESTLNGATITTFGFTMLAGTVRSKLIPDTAKFATVRKTGYSIVAAILATVLLPSWLQNKITYWSRHAWTYTTTQHRITASEGSFLNARIKRQDLADNFYPVVKIANDQIETLMVEQIKIVKKLNELEATGDILNYTRPLLFQSASMQTRLIDKLESNAADIIMYQKMIAGALDTLIEVYKKDFEALENLNSSGILAGSTAQELIHVDALIAYTLTLKDTLVTHFKASDPSFINYNDNYDDVRQIIDKYAFWGFYEVDVVKKIVSE